MSFGLYIHIPYCLQKCHYCDFTTFDLNHEISMEQYTELIMTELRSRAKHITKKSIDSIYFGGGTPSLLPAEHILAIRNEITNVGFSISPTAEISIEINPGTITEKKLDLYLAAGVNRFSVGVQTFNNKYLAAAGREHDADSSRATLRFLAENNLNYSFDLLFGLPNQTIDDLQSDLLELRSFRPKHVSLYNLTVPKNHKMNANRATDEIQAEMFECIEDSLKQSNILRYELSNFSTPGHESKHNILYWSDCDYWGLGVSAHSYFPKAGKWGTRFWNPSSHKEYVAQIAASQDKNQLVYDSLPARQVEHLAMHESITDYCHTQLRMVRGLSVSDFQQKFGESAIELLHPRLKRLYSDGLLTQTPAGFRLSPSAFALANRVFFELTFLAEDLKSATH